MPMQQQCDCLYYRVDKDMLGGEGWGWGRGDGPAAWHYDYYYNAQSSRLYEQRQNQSGTVTSHVNEDDS